MFTTLSIMCATADWSGGAHTDLQLFEAASRTDGDVSGGLARDGIEVAKETSGDTSEGLLPCCCCWDEDVFWLLLLLLEEEEEDALDEAPGEGVGVVTVDELKC